MIVLPEKFKKDISGRFNTLEPIIIIGWDQQIKMPLDNAVFVSQSNKYDLGLNDSFPNLKYKFYDQGLKISNIKESVDLEKRKFKINNVSLQFSNNNNFSEVLAQNELLIADLAIFYRTASAVTLSDCLLIYEGRISRFSHTETQIKIQAEDMTLYKLDKNIPLANIGLDERLVHKNDSGKYIPLTYGQVPYAPAIKWARTEAEKGYFNRGEFEFMGWNVIPDDVYDATGTGRSINSVINSKQDCCLFNGGIYWRIVWNMRAGYSVGITSWYALTQVLNPDEFITLTYADNVDGEAVDLLDQYNSNVPSNAIVFPSATVSSDPGVGAIFNNIISTNCVSVVGDVFINSLRCDQGTNMYGAEDGYTLANPEYATDRFFKNAESNAFGIDPEQTYAAWPDSDRDSWEEDEEVYTAVDHSMDLGPILENTRFGNFLEFEEIQWNNFSTRKLNFFYGDYGWTWDGAEFGGLRAGCPELDDYQEHTGTSDDWVNNYKKWSFRYNGTRYKASWHSEYMAEGGYNDSNIDAASVRADRSSNCSVHHYWQDMPYRQEYYPRAHAFKKFFADDLNYAIIQMPYYSQMNNNIEQYFINNNIVNPLTGESFENYPGVSIREFIADGNHGVRAYAASDGIGNMMDNGDIGCMLHRENCNWDYESWDTWSNIMNRDPQMPKHFMAQDFKGASYGDLVYMVKFSVCFDPPNEIHPYGLNSSNPAWNNTWDGCHRCYWIPITFTGEFSINDWYRTGANPNNYYANDSWWSTIEGDGYESSASAGLDWPHGQVVLPPIPLTEIINFADLPIFIPQSKTIQRVEDTGNPGTNSYQVKYNGKWNGKGFNDQSLMMTEPWNEGHPWAHLLGILGHPDVDYDEDAGDSGVGWTSNLDGRGGMGKFFFLSRTACGMGTQPGTLQNCLNPHKNFVTNTEEFNRGFDASSGTQQLLTAGVEGYATMEAWNSDNSSPGKYVAFEATFDEIDVPNLKEPYSYSTHEGLQYQHEQDLRGVFRVYPAYNIVIKFDTNTLLQYEESDIEDTKLCMGFIAHGDASTEGASSAADVSLNYSSQMDISLKTVLERANADGEVNISNIHGVNTDLLTYDSNLILSGEATSGGEFDSKNPDEAAFRHHWDVADLYEIESEIVSDTDRLAVKIAGNTIGYLGDIWSNPGQYNKFRMCLWFRKDETSSMTASLAIPIQIQFKELQLKVGAMIDGFTELDNYIKDLKGRHTDVGAIIENPANIISDFLTTECSYQGNIDQAEYQRAKDATEGWKMGFTVSEKINAKDLIQELCSNTPILPRFRNSGDLGYVALNENYDPANVMKIPQRDIVKFAFERTKIEDVITTSQVKFNYSYADEIFQAQTGFFHCKDYLGDGDLGYYNEQEQILGYRNSYYGLDKIKKEVAGIDVVLDEDCMEEVECKYITDLSTANKFNIFHTMWNCQQHLIIKATLTLSYIALEIGDIIGFDELFNGTTAYGIDYTKQQYLNGQLIHPAFLITEIQKKKDLVMIKAIQIHDLNRTFAAQTGDISRRGTSVDQPDNKPGLLDKTLMAEFLEKKSSNRFSLDQIQCMDINNSASVTYKDYLFFDEWILGDEPMNITPSPNPDNEIGTVE